jgi:hypothetical protein
MVTQKFCEEKHMNMAESLIEILEVDDCGQIGGHDGDNRYIRKTSISVFDRFLTVLNKYDNSRDIEPVCRFTVKKLTKYYIRRDRLRGDILND